MVYRTKPRKSLKRSWVARRSNGLGPIGPGPFALLSSQARSYVAKVTGVGDGVRLAELVAALSLATDLGLGQPQQHIIRQTLIAMRVADLEGLSDDEKAAIFYVSLLAWVGCVADAHEMGKWFGDDMAMRAESYLIDMTGLPFMRFMIGHVADGSPPIRRLTMIGRFLAGGSKEVQQSMAAHCETSGDLSLRLGLGPEVRDPLQQAFERWDGKGAPAKLAGGEIARIMRIVQVANDVEALHRIGGVDAAVRDAPLPARHGVRPRARRPLLRARRRAARLHRRARRLGHAHRRARRAGPRAQR